MRSAHYTKNKHSPSYWIDDEIFLWPKRRLPQTLILLRHAPARSTSAPPSPSHPTHISPPLQHSLPSSKFPPTTIIPTNPPHLTIYTRLPRHMHMHLHSSSPHHTPPHPSRKSNPTTATHSINPPFSNPQATSCPNADLACVVWRRMKQRGKGLTKDAMFHAEARRLLAGGAAWRVGGPRCQHV